MHVHAAGLIRATTEALFQMYFLDSVLNALLVVSERVELVPSDHVIRGPRIFRTHRSIFVWTRVDLS